MRKKDLTGMVFGRLTVLKEAGSKNNRIMWLCQCSCGNTKEISSKGMLRGTTRSCGCLYKGSLAEKKKKHGMSKTNMYKVWASIKDRCFNEKCKYYSLYGGRGITMCDRWKDSFENFINDMGFPPEKGMSIDRKDNNKGYSPDNCRWATQKMQCRNQSTNTLLTYKGETRPLPEWADRLGINKGTLKSRLYRGWTVDEALTRGV